MQLVLDDRDLEALHKTDGSMVTLAVKAYWKDAKGNLVAVARGEIDLERMDDLSNTVLDMLYGTCK